MTNHTTEHGSDPAKQHQDEPIMLTAVAELVDDGDGGLEASWILEGGTAELMAGMLLLVADNAPGLCEEDGSAEVFQHADSGEVERLRAQNLQLREVIEHSDSNMQRQSLRISNQRAQLAEVDALLCDIQASHGVLLMTDPPQDPWKVRRISERISAVLSARAAASESVAPSPAGNVHRYKAVQLISEAGNRIGYDPHGPDVVMAEAYDLLRADRSECWEEFKALRRTAVAREAELQERLEKRNALLAKMKALFRVDDPFDLYGQVCEALSDGVEDEMPCQGIPGTSFQRLNLLANQGE
ncbi:MULTISPECIES: DUF349 domain-containing protein [unclassified Pseudomonas]|uniref:DUF349 domain-containing protein n=1 Tax=unclassified Pseudomonas TaxID=196821 RepID=UPI000A1D9D3E|nr:MULTISPECIES: DUF349 domain-containing protein [unclassified Pseudomonas]